MILGIDFDNTIVSYDTLFHQIALERGLIPTNVPVNKSEVRNYLRSIGKEEEWTRLQGIGYGPELVRAQSYPGVKDFFCKAIQNQIPIYIISHKTKYPFMGEKHDLHAAAIHWLETQGFFREIGLPRNHVFLELTKQAKCQRIGTTACTHFLDDLPEILAEKDFPAKTQRFLFDPHQLYPKETRFTRISSWNEFQSKTFF